MPCAQYGVCHRYQESSYCQTQQALDFQVIVDLDWGYCVVSAQQLLHDRYCVCILPGPLVHHLSTNGGKSAELYLTRVIG